MRNKPNPGKKPHKPLVGRAICRTCPQGCRNLPYSTGPITGPIDTPTDTPRIGWTLRGILGWPPNPPGRRRLLLRYPPRCHLRTVAGWMSAPYQHQRVAPPIPVPAEPDPEHAVGWPERRPGTIPLKNGELVAKKGGLSRQRDAGSSHATEGPEDQKKP